MSLTLYVVFVWQFFYEVKSCRILKNLWLLTSYKICSSKELASREWVSKIINLNLVDIRFSLQTSAIQLRRSYTVSELEVRYLKRLEMIRKQNNFDITCLYLQEYKKEFAFLTKFHYFESREGLNWALKMQLKISSQTIGLTLNVFF